LISARWREGQDSIPVSTIKLERESCNYARPSGLSGIEEARKIKPLWLINGSQSRLRGVIQELGIFPVLKR